MKAPIIKSELPLYYYSTSETPKLTNFDTDDSVHIAGYNYYNID